jgi:hypothetical protein
MPLPVDRLDSADGAVSGQVLYCGVLAEEIVVRLEGEADLLLGSGEDEGDIEGRVRVYSV